MRINTKPDPYSLQPIIDEHNRITRLPLHPKPTRRPVIGIAIVLLVGMLCLVFGVFAAFYVHWRH